MSAIAAADFEINGRSVHLEPEKSNRRGSTALYRVCAPFCGVDRRRLKAEEARQAFDDLTKRAIDDAMGTALHVKGLVQGLAGGGR